ncbi:hypothetical protein BT96DRAFT_1005404 [Gymnopus androsaceus JB14]|uniref:CxC1-like cysteine cluster associated with KDZ transposases domain-containing protein n=1 Tax=Gymnopus androsaceus JB14 TaxID=1447944 RepID=A0A6A4GNX2_9AGAR|nr:hypothetical protein BT96DRAFT_1005404 [Gymnopus androsaceus JB14]
MAIYTASGQRYSQQVQLAIPIGQVGLLERPQALPVLPMMANLEASSLESEGVSVTLNLGPSVHCCKHLAQAQNWQQIVPTLVQWYLRVHLWAKVEETLHYHCQNGLFGCAQIHPTLAVELQVLYLVTGLFLRVSPNNTAVSGTLEAFLEERGYVMRGEDPLRRRFGNALQWYNTLQDHALHFVDELIDVARDEMLREDKEEDEIPAEGSAPLLRPSEYLRAHCPICFGGQCNPSSQFNAFACIDAIHHADREGLRGLGRWLARKWWLAQSKHAEVKREVLKSECSLEFLWEQWTQQVTAQTQPLPRQSKNAGKKVIEDAVRMRTVIGTLEARISRLEEVACDLNESPYLMTEAQEKLPGLTKELKDKKRSLSHLDKALGVDQMNTYQHLASSEFITLRMNACAKKIHLRDRLRARKFEQDRLECAVHRQQYNECKIQGHTEDSVKRRKPGIVKLAKEYNSLCQRMHVLISKQSAPRNAIAPEPIPLKELFRLDVDDAIWQDVGLDDSADTGAPPQWLCDDKVRKGIKAILECDRCEEELRRLRAERSCLLEWMQEEWCVLERATEEVIRLGDADLLYHFNARRAELTQLCVWWRSAMQDMPEDVFLPPWAPPVEVLDAMERELGSEVWSMEDEPIEQVSEEEPSSSESDMDDLDPGLLEHLDALEIVDLAEAELDGDMFF